MVKLQRWSLMEGEWSCYRVGKFNGGRMVILGGQFNGGRMVVAEVVTNGVTMVMLQRWLVYWK